MSMRNILFAGVVAIGASAFAGVRTMDFTETKTNGLVTSLTVNFGEASETSNTLFLAYGAAVGGDTPGSWTSCVKVADVAPETASVTVASPEGWGKTVFAMRLFLADGEHASALRKLEYVQGDGNGRFPLGFVPTADTRSQLKFVYEKNSGNCFYGTPTDVAGDSADYRMFRGGGNNTIYFDVGSARVSKNDFFTDTTSVFELEFGDHYVKDLATGSDIVRAESTVDLTDYATSLYLFTSADYGKAYYLKVYEGETLAHDFIPSVDEDGKAKLYDAVTGEIISYEGFGAAKAGPCAGAFAFAGDVTAAATIDLGSVSAAKDFAKRIVVKPNELTAPATGAYTEVPVLLRLSESIDGFKYSDFKRNGYDLLVMDETGSVMPHEIEVWNPEGESLVWTKVLNYSSDTRLFVYYGADGIPQDNDPTQVWSAYAGVWHFDETQQGGSCKDSSPNGYDTANLDANTAAESGILGGARNMVGSGMTVPNTTKMNLGYAFTVQGWVTRNAVSGGSWDHLFYKKDASGDWGGWCTELYGQDGAYGRMSVLGGTSRNSSTDNAVHGIKEANIWYHILIVYDGKTATLYNNGVKTGTSVFNRKATWVDENGDNIRNLAFACASNGSGAGWNGNFDEFRICTGAMDADRASFEYKTIASAAFSYKAGDNVDTRPVLTTPTVTRNADGTFSVGVELTAGVATSVKVIGDGFEQELATSGAEAPWQASAVLANLPADATCKLHVVAENDDDFKTIAYSDAAFYTGTITVAKDADAREEKLVAGAFVFSRAETAAATAYALPIAYTVGGTATAGSDYVALSGVTEIPAGAASVTVTVAPLKNTWTDTDVTVTATVAGGMYSPSANSATVTVFNCRNGAVMRYRHRLPLELKSGVAPATELADFPVLVHLKAQTGGFSYADFQRTDHADLAFAADDGTVIPYEIDTWNPDGESLVWVKVPALKNGLKLYVLYGADTAAENNPSDVWSYYAGVWHLNETGGDAVAISDSSMNAIGGVGLSGSTSQAGVIGTARKGQALVTDPGSVLTGIRGYVTVSMWVNIAKNVYWEHLVTALQKENDKRWGFQFTSGNNSLRFWTDGGKEPRLSYGDALAVGEWVRFDCVYDKTTGRLYRNGTLVTEKNIENWANGAAMANNQLGFGCMVGNAKDNLFTGALDEIRLATKATSAEWIAASYKFETEDCFAAGDVVSHDPKDLVGVDYAALSEDGASVEFSLVSGQGDVYAIVRNTNGKVTTNLVASAVTGPQTIAVPIKELPRDGWLDVRILAVSETGAYDERDWSETVYNFPKARRIKYTVRGYTGEAVADFPTLVRAQDGEKGFDISVLNDQTSGTDVWFTDADGNALDSECESLVANGESLFWVKLPTMQAGTVFFMNFGSAEQAEAAATKDESDVTAAAASRVAVWAGQTGVWHMDDSTTTYAYNSAATDMDVLRGWNNGTVYSDTGMVGTGRLLSKGLGQGSKGSHIVVSDNDALDLGGTFTVSGWFKYQNKNQDVGYDRLFSRKTNYESNDGWEVSLVKNSPYGLDVRGGAKASCGATMNAPINDAEWHFLTFVYTDTMVSVYENGERILDNGNITTAATSSEKPFVIGNNGSYGEVTFKGTVDEVRYGAGALSADRIKADYQTVADPDFLSAKAYNPGFVILFR